MKVLIVSGTDHEHSQYTDLMKEKGWTVLNTDIAEVQDADLLLLTGGADVNPAWYGDTAHPTTFFDTERDANDLSFHNAAKLLDIPIAGICRGAQFLNVMNDGYLVQDITNHKSTTHKIKLSTGEEMNVAGDHHQMLAPSVDAKLLAWAAPSLSEHYETGGTYKYNGTIEPEIVYWEGTKSIGFQYHPEWMAKGSEGRELFHYMIDELFFK